jgi:hypothetical protein
MVNYWLMMGVNLTLPLILNLQVDKSLLNAEKSKPCVLDKIKCKTFNNVYLALHKIYGYDISRFEFKETTMECLG